MRHPFAVGLGALMLVGCTPDRDRLAADLRSAATARHMPKVVACWEKVFEESGFAGEYLVVVDFTVTEQGDLERTTLREAFDQSSGEPTRLADGGSFGDCVVAALDDTNLGAAGLTPDAPIAVTGFRIAFSDPSQKARERASKNAPSLLIGPRSDRCQGLYAHDPPRDAGLLSKLLDESRSEALASDADRDELARAYQRGFDLTLELSDRLKRDASEDELPRASKKRLLDELERVKRLEGELRSHIGCR